MPFPVASAGDAAGCDSCAAIEPVVSRATAARRLRAHFRTEEWRLAEQVELWMTNKEFIKV